MNSSDLKKIFPYILIIFLGCLGFALPFPILPEMFIGQKASILPIHFTPSTKSIFLGFALAAYPMGQLIGSPILGMLSDHCGRKKVILSSLLLTVLGYGIVATAVTHRCVYGILVGLFFCGLSEGNVGIAQATISDLAGSKEKSRKVLGFGAINLVISLAFVVGPLLGGCFTNATYGFSFATPFWIAAILFCCAFGIIWFFAQETFQKKQQTRIGFFKQIQQNFHHRVLRRLYIVAFFIYCGGFTFWNCFPIYLEKMFAFSSQKIASAVAYQALFFALSILLIVKPLSKKIGAINLAIGTAVAFAVMLIMVTMPSSSIGILWTNPFVGIILAILITNVPFLISNAAQEGMQGQAMGSLQSIQCLAAVLISAFSGYFFKFSPVFPFIVGACLTLLGGCLLWKSKQLLHLDKQS